MRPVRIANCSGFFADRMSALAEVAAEPGIDVITGDYLAEVTMLVLAKSKAKRPDGSYASTFLKELEPALGRIADAGIKVVSNAGGLNPHGLPMALREMVAAAGYALSVAVVDGDDRRSDLDRLAAEGPPSRASRKRTAADHVAAPAAHGQRLSRRDARRTSSSACRSLSDASSTPRCSSGASMTSPT